MNDIITKAIDKSYDWLNADGAGGWVRCWLVAIPIAAIIVTLVCSLSSNEVLSEGGNPVAAGCAARATVMRIIAHH